jgi:hypothetical protein
MRADLPDTLPDFRLPPREEYNAGVSEERPLSPVRMAYEITELAKIVGTVKLASSLTQLVLTLQQDVDDLIDRVDNLSESEKQNGFTKLTGTADKSTSWDTESMTLGNLTRRVKAIQDALRAYGIIGD